MKVLLHNTEDITVLHAVYIIYFIIINIIGR